MRLIEYTPKWFDRLESAVEKMGRGKALGVREFVDHYYAGNPWGKLWLAIDDQSEEIAGTVGIEFIPFECSGEILPVGFGSNFHTLLEGCGGLLFLKWTRSTRHNMSYNSSDQARALTDAQKWQSLNGVTSLQYNSPPERGSDSRSLIRSLKRLIKRTVLRRPSLSRILPKFQPREFPHSRVAVEPFESWSSDRLDFDSPFDFRVAPEIAYFEWRFPFQWSGFRYAHFSIVRDGTVCGLIILHICDDQVLVVHADGSDERTIAEGILLALSKTDGPAVYYLATSLPEVARLCEAVGFRRNSEESRLFFSPRFPLEKIRSPLINFGLGDNDLRLEYLSR